MSLLTIDGHERESTNNRVFVGALDVQISCGIAELPCQAKVDKKNGIASIIGSDSKITWFDVAMDVVSIM
jgi:hypothetical protein